MGLSCGLGFREIAEVMRFISETNATVIANRMYEKLGVQNSQEACYLWGRYEGRL